MKLENTRIEGKHEERSIHIWLCEGLRQVKRKAVFFVLQYFPNAH